MRTLIDLITGISLARNQERADWIAETAAVTADDRVLDIGCGPGNALISATRRGATAIGLDPSPTMLWLAARRVAATGPVVLLPASVAAIPLPCASVTVAWAVGSFHHWPDIDAGLAEVVRVLAPGGRFFVVEAVAKGHGFHAAHAISPVRADGLAQLLTDGGFVNATVETTQVGHREMLVVSAAIATAPPDPASQPPASGSHQSAAPARAS
jgi:ubiquinone/menaquinone biosynthesis C-methylase UbiE